jgi:hypothetical protein
MGWIPAKMDPTGKATFGFDFVVNPSAGTSTFQGSYHDPQGLLVGGKVVEVAFKGQGVLKPGPPPPEAPAGAERCLLGLPHYQSQSPDLRGGGQLELTVCDMGNGPGAGDFILIQVLDGPYALYQNGGFPQGNIHVQKDK